MNPETASREIELKQIFRPSAPINRRELFAGRKDQVNQLVNGIFQVGQHATVYGERGVGKTSLVSILTELLENPVKKGGLIYVRVNCDSTQSFTKLWQVALRQITWTERVNGIGFTPADKSHNQRSLVDLLPEDTSPEDIRFILQQVGFCVIVLDEVDRAAPEVVRLLADTIKTLSDYSVPATLILVGVADSVDDLIEGHQSIERALVQILMPRMQQNELVGALNLALSKAKMRITEDAELFIANIARGMPHYIHLIGLEAAIVAVRNGRDLIAMKDAETAIQNALITTQRSIQREYHSAVNSRQKTLHSDVLLACALADTDEMGFFMPSNVKYKINQVAKKRYDVSAFKRHLDDFCSESRGKILQQKGKSHSYRYRFSNPLMQPYVLMRGIVDGKIADRELADMIEG